MATDVDICNLALGHLQGEADVSSINPVGTTTEAKLCAKFYPIARDVLLEMHNWGFATFREALAPLTNPPEGWDYVFKAPNNFLKAQVIYTAGSGEFPLDFDMEADEQEGNIVLANVEAPFMKFTKRVTVAPRFSPLFVTSVSWLLASYLAGPLGKSVEDRNGALREFGLNFGLASASNSNNRKEGGNTQKPENYDPHKSRK